MGLTWSVQSDMSDRFGINIKRYCRAHEAALRNAPASQALLERHLEKLRWLQHERLIHLIVLVMTVVAELFVVDLAVLHPETNPLAAVVMLALAVLLAFYFYHYFFLENTVQRWYVLADRLRNDAPPTKAPPPAAVQEDSRAIQQKAMECARANQKPRVGA